MRAPSCAAAEGETAAAQGSEAAALAAARGGWLQSALRDAVAKHGEQGTFYCMFGIPDFAEMDRAGRDRLEASFWSQVRAATRGAPPALRPRGGGGAAPPALSGEELKARSCALALARRVLLQPDMKRRYDLELRRAQEAGDGSEQGWSCLLIGSVVLLTVGYTTIVVGSVLAVHGIVALATCIGGSAALTAGIRGCILVGGDPDCSAVDFCKDLTVGALQGVAGGLACTFVGLAPFSAPFLIQYLHVTFCGAAIQGTGMVIQDVGDVLCSNGYLGQHAKDNASHVRTTDDIFNWTNVLWIALSSWVGPLFAHQLPLPPSQAELEASAGAFECDSGCCVCGSCARPRGPHGCAEACSQRSRELRRALRLPIHGAARRAPRTADADAALMMAGCLLVPYSAAPVVVCHGGAANGPCTTAYAMHFFDLISAFYVALSEPIHEEKPRELSVLPPLTYDVWFSEECLEASPNRCRAPNRAQPGAPARG